MTYHSESLAALIGSRICHDLISPIGAVNNGLELLALAGGQGGPEMALVNDSAASANARIRLYRLAFGIASPGQISRGDEITDIWRGVHANTRFGLDWTGPATLPRREARLIVLACLCAEVALPQGGTLRVERDETGWHVHGAGPRLSVDHALWDRLTRLQNRDDVPPAHVQFLLLPGHLHEMGRLCRYDTGANHVRISF